MIARLSHLRTRRLIRPDQLPGELGWVPCFLLSAACAVASLQDTDILNVRTGSAHLNLLDLGGSKAGVDARVAAFDLGEIEPANCAELELRCFLGGGSVVALPDSGPFVAHFDGMSVAIDGEQSYGIDKHRKDEFGGMW